uniref:Uncharacterized protein n=1 Tax=Solanum tuberosum TaxID=4113 RepID=M1BTD7_SOLTU
MISIRGAHRSVRFGFSISSFSTHFQSLSEATISISLSAFAEDLGFFRTSCAGFKSDCQAFLNISACFGRPTQVLRHRLGQINMFPVPALTESLTNRQKTYKDTY